MNDIKQSSLINFKKTHSLLAKIIKMIEDDNYCVDIMRHNMAAIGLLRSAHQKLMEGHLNTCFKKAMQTQNDKRKQEMIDEILTVIKFVNK